MDKKERMLQAFDAFTERIDQRYAEARRALADDRPLEALTILDRLTISHAKTSLSLRNKLVKDGTIGDE